MEKLLSSSGFPVRVGRTCWAPEEDTEGGEKSPAEAHRPVFPVRQSPCRVSKNINMTECRLLRKEFHPNINIDKSHTNRAHSLPRIHTLASK